ncbi:competence type IV pilus minor pilin ComGD [Alkalihalobacillus pseudalcaliphilus]|uniref:competence type IV pilus minor pilin ComGD n=1 Tax=Alkalihalobacillus pseudalcaliphilus TaxID=79884 RepID=UPI00064DFA45|nr:competence type IV pilus minor pilin ComGD [Alkalihalobacillus pseudalcaliphilus]KMK76962.1 hypothetical protein AB990_05215 [Alkalihalobacillus pseudalcaliphilus]
MTLNQHFDERGLTFFEMLMVLFILSILLLLPILSFPSLQSEKSPDEIAEGLKKDLIMAQHLAMTTGRTVYVIFNLHQQTLVIRHHSAEIIYEKPFDYGQRLSFSSPLSHNNISFNQFGHPRLSGSFDLIVASQTYRFTIYLGKGMIDYYQR